MHISIVCVPYQGDVARWGFARGPQAILEQGLVEAIRARGHVVAEPAWVEFPRSERTRDTVTNLGRIAMRTAAAVSAALKQHADLVLVLEGNCTHAPGAVGGLAQAGVIPGVVWLDAHGDMNTMQTTTTGLWGGMPYAVILGWDLADWREAAGLVRPVKPEAAALIGASDLDEEEIVDLERHPILRIDTVDMVQPGVAERVQAALKERADQAGAWYLHVDVDVAGPEEVLGVMTPAPYWPPRQHLIDAATATVKTLPVKVAAIAAYNPSTDVNKRGAGFCLDMALAIVDALAGASMKGT